jgi:hypothetical protein
MNRLESPPASVDTFEPVEVLLFKLYRRYVVSMTMTAFRGVEELDVIEDVTARLFSIDIDLAADA